MSPLSLKRKYLLIEQPFQVSLFVQLIWKILTQLKVLKMLLQEYKLPRLNTQAGFLLMIPLDWGKLLLNELRWISMNLMSFLMLAVEFMI